MTQVVHPIILTPSQILRAQHESSMEFVRGQLVEKPVSFESSRIAATILFLLRQYVQKAGGVEICDSSLGYQCFVDEPSRYRKPDVSAILSERLK